MNDYFKLFLSQEAEEFLYSLPVMARRKMMYNIRRIKKTQKTPLKEIIKAERLRQEYFNNKKTKTR